MAEAGGRGDDKEAVAGPEADKDTTGEAKLLEPEGGATEDCEVIE